MEYKLPTAQNRAVVLTILHQEIDEGVYVRTRMNGKLYNLACLKPDPRRNSN